MNFSDALNAIKQGKKAAREGWNGKGLFVYLVPKNTYPAQTDAAKSVFGENVPYASYLALVNRTLTGNPFVCTWVPSIGDLLSEDWAIVE
jgi:hypothetical protein